MLPGEEKMALLGKKQEEALSGGNELEPGLGGGDRAASVAVGLYVTMNRLLLCDISLSHLVSGRFGSTVCLGSKAWLGFFHWMWEPVCLKEYTADRNCFHGDMRNLEVLLMPKI